MPKIQNTGAHSLEGRYLDTINSRMMRLYEFVPEEDNSYLAAYHRAMNEAGIEVRYRTRNGVEVPVIANTKENRDKVDELRRKLVEQKAKTMDDIRKQARYELKQQGKRVTPGNMRIQMKTLAAYQTLHSNLEYVYQQEAAGDFSNSKYPDSLRGLKRGEEPVEYGRRVLDIARNITMKRLSESDEKPSWPSLA